ncbi:MAG: YceI family protein [Deltaproteobacteria bacterium]|nr:YceI family protein [Deltaproteobacteria bacterium]
MSRQSLLSAALSAALSATLLPAAALAAPGSFAFTGTADFVSDAPLEKINGQANGGGAVTLDLADLTTLSGTIVMPVRTMKTGNAQRDDHLYGSDWLEADKCPDVKLELKGAKVESVETKGDITVAKLVVNGSFGLHCQSKDLAIPVTLKAKAGQAKVSASFSVSLADFKVAGKAGVVGEKVGNSIAVTVNLSGAQGG